MRPKVIGLKVPKEFWLDRFLLQQWLNNHYSGTIVVVK